MPLELTISAPRQRQAIAFMRRGILAAHKILRSPLKDLSIAIVAAKEMAALHKAYLRQAGPTDVLTFELEHDSRKRVTSGEIVICSSVAKERARGLGHSTQNELLLYAIHGLLHLSGFDDRTASAFAAMHAKEDQILTRLGIGPIFSTACAGDGRCTST